MKDSSTRGFTLIELLVVVSIIGFLASVVLASVNTARIKGEDAKRLSDLRQINHALELYHTQFGSYPATAGAGWQMINNSGWGVNIGLAPTFIRTVPFDVVNTADPELRYYYRSDGVSYCIQISQLNPAAIRSPYYRGTWTNTYKLRYPVPAAGLCL